jgi:hypothetical protein
LFVPCRQREIRAGFDVHRISYSEPASRQARNAAGADTQQHHPAAPAIAGRARFDLL